MTGRKSGTGETTMLRAEHLSAQRGDRMALADVNAAFAPGRVSAILGPNGSGKSTLVELLAGLRAPDGGRVLLGDCPMATMPARERARRIGYLPQAAELHWNLLVEDLVALGRGPRRSRFGALNNADRAAIDGALDVTDTAQYRTRLAGSLSGGERARVLLARVLAGEPEWILADEPLASLDPAHQLEVLEALESIAARGVGVVLVLHDLTLAHRAADDVLVLREGQVAAVGQRDVLDAPGLLERVYSVRFDRAEQGGRAMLAPSARIAHPA